MDPGPRQSITINTVRTLLQQAQVGAFAAQAAFFILLSAIPFLVFLTEILRCVPWDGRDLSLIFPTEFNDLVRSILPETPPSPTLLSVSAATALWSASRGILALTRGLNRMFGREETRNYVLLRLFALAETLILELALLCTLGGVIRGEEVCRFLGLSEGWGTALQTVGGGILLTLFFLFLYTVLPDRSTSLSTQIPGAAGAAIGWIVFTKGFTVYAAQSANFPRIYGTLSNVAALMIWLWLCLCILFLGAFLNRILSLL